MPNPEIRFLDENASNYPDWENFNLGDILIEKHEKNKKLEYLDVWSVNNKLGFIKQQEQFDNRVVASSDVSNYKIIYPDMYAYNPSRINIGSIARSKTDKIGIVSPMYIAFALSKKINPIFFDNYIKTFQFQNNIKSSTMGSVRDSLSFKSLQLFNFSLPHIEEQERIAEFFTSLDNNIKNCDAKLKNIKKYKKSMLQRMFSESGNPEVRFLNENGSDYPDWEISSISDIANIFRGGSPRPISEYITKDSNSINWLKIGDISESSKYIYSTRKKISLDGAKYSRIVNEGDLILSNSMSFGRPYIMRTTTCIHDGWLTLKLTSKITTEFMYYLLTSPCSQYKFKSLAQGSSVNNLKKELVETVKINYPVNIEEQERIAEFFSSLDRQIDLYSKKLDNLKKYKKSMLQKMFV